MIPERVSSSVWDSRCSVPLIPPNTHNWLNPKGRAVYASNVDQTADLPHKCEICTQKHYVK